MNLPGGKNMIDPVSEAVAKVYYQQGYDARGEAINAEIAELQKSNVQLHGTISNQATELNRLRRECRNLVASLEAERAKVRDLRAVLNAKDER